MSDKPRSMIDSTDDTSGIMYDVEVRLIRRATDESGDVTNKTILERKYVESTSNVRHAEEVYDLLTGKEA